MSSQHKLKPCLDCMINTTTKTWCKPCGYKNRKIEIWNKGLPCSLETKHKISEAKKGIKNPKHSEWLKNNPVSHWLGKKRPDISEENSESWKGDKVGYRGLHQWVQKHLGKPGTCEHCATTGLSGRRIHWANISHKYKRDLTDWARLCAKCHKSYDMGRITL